MTATLSVLHACAPAPFGGLESVVAALTTGLARRGHRVMLVAVLDREAEVPAPISAAVDGAVDLVPLRLPARAYAAERHAVHRLAAAHGADVVHTHGYRSDVVAGPIARRIGAARVSTAHGFTGGGPRNRAYEWLQRRSLRRCDAVVAVSDALARSLAAAGVPAVHTVVNGAFPQPAALPAASARATLGAPEGAFHVGWVGRLSREKGPDVLLEALARLPADLDWTATVVGEGSLRPGLEARVAQPPLRGRVRLAGRVDDAARLFSAFDAIVLSSRTEGTPVVLLEAIGAGTPVVATRVGGVEAAAGAGGALFVEPEDAAGLARAIADVAADPAGARRRAARALALRDAAPDWIGAYERIYRDVIGSPPAGVDR